MRVESSPATIHRSMMSGSLGTGPTPSSSRARTGHPHHPDTATNVKEDYGTKASVPKRADIDIESGEQGEFTKENPSVAPPGRASEVIIADEGFTVLADPVKPSGDIVLIHGIQGHPRRTWLYKEKNVFRKTVKRFYWPTDLLTKDFKTCRILAYGYDSQVSKFFSGTANQTNILAHARSFLREYEELREECVRRPIIFVVHSLGGILLKAILRASYETKQTPANNIICNVCESTAGTIFLGTPHKGSDYANLGEVVSLAARAVQFDRSVKILRDLAPDATILEILNDTFLKILDEKGFALHTFAESQGLGIPLVARDKVVPSSSAHLGLPNDIENKEDINANHLGMCRFKGGSDHEYGKIRRAINRSFRDHKAHELDLDFEKALKGFRSLGTNNRLLSVEPPLQNTYNWIFDKSIGFLDWLHSPVTSPFWIQGKPASGKSTLMKMVYQDSRIRDACHVEGYSMAMAAFFFHDRGSIWEKTLTGLLQQILCQVLDELSMIKEHFRTVFMEERETTHAPIRNRNGFEWTMDLMMRVFVRILQQDMTHISLVFFFDALDEYDGKHSDMVKFLRSCRGTEKTRVKICFSSRPEQIFLDNFSDFSGLCIHEHTRGDIEALIHAAFQENALSRRTQESGFPREQELLLRLKITILDLADGVFLWVRLVVEELLTQYTDGSTVKELFGLLKDKIPRELAEYYDYLVTTRLKPEYEDERNQMMEIVRCAEQPLLLHDFLKALHFAMNEEPPLQHDVEQARRRLNSRCGQLLQISTTHMATPPYIWPIHNDDDSSIVLEIGDSISLENIEESYSSIHLEGKGQAFNLMSENHSDTATVGENGSVWEAGSFDIREYYLTTKRHNSNGIEIIERSSIISGDCSDASKDDNDANVNFNASRDDDESNRSNYEHSSIHRVDDTDSISVSLHSDSLHNHLIVQFSHQTVKTWTWKRHQANSHIPSSNGYVYLLRTILFPSEGSPLPPIPLLEKVIFYTNAADRTTDGVALRQIFIHHPGVRTRTYWSGPRGSTSTRIATRTPLQIAALARARRLFQGLLAECAYPNTLITEFLQLWKDGRVPYFSDTLALLLETTCLRYEKERVWREILDMFYDFYYITDHLNTESRMLEDILKQLLKAGLDPRHEMSYGNCREIFRNDTKCSEHPGCGFHKGPILHHFVICVLALQVNDVTQNEWEVILDLLLKSNAGINTLDSAKCTPLDLAAEYANGHVHHITKIDGTALKDKKTVITEDTADDDLDWFRHKIYQYIVSRGGLRHRRFGKHDKEHTKGPSFAIMGGGQSKSVAISEGAQGKTSFWQNLRSRFFV